MAERASRVGQAVELVLKKACKIPWLNLVVVSDLMSCRCRSFERGWPVTRVGGCRRSRMNKEPKKLHDCSNRKAIICRLSAYEQADDVTDVRKEVKRRSDSSRI